jgi:histidinol-phosphate aminotransferase
MTTNRRDWLKTAILGGTALVFSPLEILAKEIPNYKEIIQNADVIRLCFNENPFELRQSFEAMQKSLGFSSMYDFRFADIL